MIRIAVQKSGRLHEKTLNLLQECGLALQNGKGSLKMGIRNFPAEILFLRDDDIPQYVEDRVADIGIIGENVLLENSREINLVERLGFARCRLSFAVPENTDYQGLDFLNGRKIATSYPKIVGNYLAERNIESEIHVISGSVEIATGIGLADAICDIVSTGSTLLSNGLKEVETVLKSEAVLVARHDLPDEQNALLERLLFRIRAVQKAQNNKYILLNVPDSAIEKVCEVIPGMRSPTVMPLRDKGWSSLHSVVNEDEFWSKIDELKNLGAEGILVIPIEKMIS